jgi:hypothetical protein
MSQYEAYRNIRVKVLSKYIDNGFFGFFKTYYLEVITAEAAFKPTIWALPTSKHTFSMFPVGREMYIKCYYDGKGVTPILS